MLSSSKFELQVETFCGIWYLVKFNRLVIFQFSQFHKSAESFAFDWVILGSLQVEECLLLECFTLNFWVRFTVSKLVFIQNTVNIVYFAYRAW